MLSFQRCAKLGKKKCFSSKGRVGNFSCTICQKFDNDHIQIRPAPDKKRATEIHKVNIDRCRNHWERGATRRQGGRGAMPGSARYHHLLTATHRLHLSFYTTAIPVNTNTNQSHCRALRGNSCSEASDCNSLTLRKQPLIWLNYHWTSLVDNTLNRYFVFATPITHQTLHNAPLSQCNE